MSLDLSIKPIFITLVRHGETEANKLKIIQGQLDTDLNDLGIRQAELVANALKETAFTHAFSSDLKRAKHVMTLFLFF